MQKHSVLLVLVAAAFTFSPTASAQKLHRCGNQYQDTPCGAPGGKAVNATGAGQSAPTGKTGDIECRQRGDAAQKLMVAREAGVTQDRAMNEIAARKLSPERTTAEQQLVASVYGRRGAIPQMRAAIEEECVAEKARAPQTSAAPPAAAASPPAAEKPSPVLAEDRAATAAKAAQRKAACDSIEREMVSVRDQLRAGGSAAQMNSFNEQRRRLETQAGTAGC
ncbi:MAG: hypothetical protein ACKVQQ_13855 [Burkholderiales bacterium]